MVLLSLASQLLLTVHELYALCNERRCIATITCDEDVVLKLDGKPDLSLLPPEMVWTAKLDPVVHSRPRIAAIQGSGIVAEIKQDLLSRYANEINLYDSIGPNGKIVITITAKPANIILSGGRPMTTPI